MLPITKEPLDDHELRSYQKLPLLPLFVAAILVGTFLGLLTSAFILLAFSSYYYIPVGLLLSVSMYCCSVIVFTWMLRSIHKENKQVLANPYKHILKVTIYHINEITRHDEKKYLIQFEAEEHDLDYELKTEVSHQKMMKLKKHKGTLYLHVEVNFRKILKICDEDEYPLLIC